jgi:hypothetical protein
MNKGFVLVLGLFCLLVSCATSYVKEDQEMAESLDSRIGIMTYDDALEEQGEPSKITEGKNIIVVEWSETKTIHMDTMSITHSQTLRYTFNKKTLRLKSWNYRRD